MQQPIKEIVRKKNGYSLWIRHSELKEKSSEVYLFLHGVPAIGYKNEDIARAVTENTKNDSVVIHYRGLGEAKEFDLFDFVESIKESLEFAKMLTHEYEIVHLVGHSWGGCIALNVYREILESNQRGQVILMAPFTEFVKDGSVESWLIPMSKDGRIPLRVGPEGAVHNFFQVESLYPPKKDIEKLTERDSQFTVIEAINDPDLSNEHTKNLVHQLEKGGNSVQYFHLEDDHLFTKNRKNIINTVLNSINEYAINNTKSYILN